MQNIIWDYGGKMQAVKDGCIITKDNIVWRYLPHYNNHICFISSAGNHIIAYDIVSHKYCLWEDGKVKFESESVSECLENASDIVWDFIINQLMEELELK